MMHSKQISHELALFRSKMKHKLLKDVAAHYNLVNNRMSPEAIKSHVKLALNDLYCAFCGFDSHIEGGEMVYHGCSFGSLF